MKVHTLKLIYKLVLNCNERSWYFGYVKEFFFLDSDEQRKQVQEKYSKKLGNSADMPIMVIDTRAGCSIENPIEID